jgi:hypothetical protein
MPEYYSLAWGWIFDQDESNLLNNIQISLQDFMKSYDLEITRVVTIHHYFPPNSQEPLNFI